MRSRAMPAVGCVGPSGRKAREWRGAGGGGRGAGDGWAGHTKLRTRRTTARGGVALTLAQPCQLLDQGPKLLLPRAVGHPIDPARDQIKRRDRSPPQPEAHPDRVEETHPDPES